MNGYIINTLIDDALRRAKRGKWPQENGKFVPTVETGNDVRLSLTLEERRKEVTLAITLLDRALKEMTEVQ